MFAEFIWTCCDPCDCDCDCDSDCGIGTPVDVLSTLFAGRGGNPAACLAAFFLWKSAAVRCDWIVRSLMDGPGAREAIDAKSFPFGLDMDCEDGEGASGCCGAATGL